MDAIVYQNGPVRRRGTRALHSALHPSAALCYARSVRLIKIVLVVLLAVIVGAGIIYASSSRFRLFTMVLTGRSAVCPMQKALDINAHLAKMKQADDRIYRASHLVRRDGTLELWDTPDGQYWIPANNRYVLPFNLAEMEMHIYGTGEHFVHAGDIVLDCGASDGDFTRQALAAGAKLVVAIEISPRTVECLRRNLAQPVAEHRAIIVPKGVWDRDDTLPLDVEDRNFAANTVALHPNGSHPQGTAELTTIDEIVSDLKLPRVDFIKMDIEGAEVPALHGARQTIARFHPRLAIATEHKDTDETAIPAAVRQIRSDYAGECGYCAVRNGRVQPEVMYFY